MSEPKGALELLEECRLTLERTECQFFACEGPTVAPTPCVTCFVCANLGEVSEYLAHVEDQQAIA